MESISMLSGTTRVEKIILVLRKEYSTRTALLFNSPFEILIATMLAAQCTDERVNKITSKLFRKYKGPKDLAWADPADLEEEIRSTGFFRQKAKNIINSSKTIVRDFDSKVPDEMADLLTLPGVARKTANIVLSSGFKKAQGIAVDTHVTRLSIRLGLSDKKDAQKIEQGLLKIVAKKDWLDFNYLLVGHGRKICRARKPLCPKCLINHLCPSGKKFYPTIELKNG